MKPQSDIPSFGYAKFFCAMVFAFVAAFNLTGIAASLNPYLGVVTLLVTLLVTVAVLDRLGERWAPRAVRVFGSWCCTTVRHIRAE